MIGLVDGKEIPLHELKYWSVERQEPYADAAASQAACRRPDRTDDVVMYEGMRWVILRVRR